VLICAAIERRTDRADGQPRPTPFTAGTVGDDYTQVLSGLREGQELLLPTPPAG
jgi:HlyD family secretion protein